MVVECLFQGTSTDIVRRDFLRDDPKKSGRWLRTAKTMGGGEQEEAAAVHLNGKDPSATEWSNLQRLTTASHQDSSLKLPRENIPLGTAFLRVEDCNPVAFGELEGTSSEETTKTRKARSPHQFTPPHEAECTRVERRKRC